MAEPEKKKTGKHKTVITAVTPGSVTSQRIHPHGATSQKRIIINDSGSKKISQQTPSVEDLEQEEDVSDIQPSIVGQEAEPKVIQKPHRSPLFIVSCMSTLIALIVVIAMMMNGKRGPSLADQAAHLKTPPVDRSTAENKPGLGKAGTRTSAMKRGLIGHWTFDGHIKDTGSKRMAGSYSGDAEYVKGVIGQALKLNGTHAVEVVPDTLVDKINRFYTISAWIRLPRDETPVQHAGIFTRGDHHYRLSLGGDKNPASLHLGQNSGAEMKHMLIWGKRGDLNDGKWHHVVAVRDNEHIFTMIDGKQDVSRNKAVDDLAATTAPIWIGGNSDFVNDPKKPQLKGRYLKGELDDVRLYIRAFTPEEVKELYALGKPKRSSAP